MLPIGLCGQLVVQALQTLLEVVFHQRLCTCVKRKRTCSQQELGLFRLLKHGFCTLFKQRRSAGEKRALGGIKCP